ncbi:MAG: hypothetical protein CMO01_31870 [Thalassobius sp.]|nr:hypothetical protein [Thalassovita sp.]
MIKIYFRNFLCVIVLLAAAFNVYGQDVQYTQFRNSPTYLNPAFTGLSGSEYTFRTHYRRQWYPVFDTPLNAFNASFDYSSNAMFTFGAHFTNESISGADGSLYKTSGISVTGGWRIPTKFMVFQPALQVSYFSRTLDFDQLVFVDELLYDNPSAFEAGSMVYSFPSFSSGLAFYNEIFWGGFSMHHIDQLFKNREGVLLNEYHSPFRWSVHGGINLPVPVLYDINFLASANYRRQEGSEQLDISAGFSYASLYSLEAQYRGVPGNSPNDKLINSSSVAFIASLLNVDVWGTFMHFSYSYDYNFTGTGIQDSSHEISIRLNYSSDNWLNRRQNTDDRIKMNCPLSTSSSKRRSSSKKRGKLKKKN